MTESSSTVLLPHLPFSLELQGGGSGIGLAVARGLASKGAAVYVADITQQAPAELQGQANVHFFADLDVSSRAACKAFLDAIPGRLDGVVNSAGICPLEGKMASDDLYERVMAVNVGGTWNMGTEAILRMSQQDAHTSEGLVPGSERSLPAGSIVTISSGAGMHGVANLAAYSASKHAVVGLTRSWAKDWPSLRINSVSPGQSCPSFAPLVHDMAVH